MGFSSIFANSQAAFIFVNTTIAEKNRYEKFKGTIAHELGHYLGLKHPWETTANNCQMMANYDANNIMDYPQGGDNRNLFRKYDWQIIESKK